MVDAHTWAEWRAVFCEFDEPAAPQPLALPAGNSAAPVSASTDSSNSSSGGGGGSSNGEDASGLLDPTATGALNGSPVGPRDEFFDKPHEHDLVTPHSVAGPGRGRSGALANFRTTPVTVHARHNADHLMLTTAAEHRIFRVHTLSALRKVSRDALGSGLIQLVFAPSSTPDHPPGADVWTLFVPEGRDSIALFRWLKNALRCPWSHVDTETRLIEEANRRLYHMQVHQLQLQHHQQRQQLAAVPPPPQLQILTLPLGHHASSHPSGSLALPPPALAGPHDLHHAGFDPDMSQPPPPPQQHRWASASPHETVSEVTTSDSEGVSEQHDIYGGTSTLGPDSEAEVRVQGPLGWMPEAKGMRTAATNGHSHGHTDGHSRGVAARHGAMQPPQAQESSASLRDAVRDAAGSARAPPGPQARSRRRSSFDAPTKSSERRVSQTLTPSALTHAFAPPAVQQRKWSDRSGPSTTSASPSSPTSPPTRKKRLLGGPGQSRSPLQAHRFGARTVPGQLSQLSHEPQTLDLSAAEAARLGTKKVAKASKTKKPKVKQPMMSSSGDIMDYTRVQLLFAGYNTDLIGIRELEAEIRAQSGSATIPTELSSKGEFLQYLENLLAQNDGMGVKPAWRSTTKQSARDVTGKPVSVWAAYIPKKFQRQRSANKSKRGGFL